MENRIYISSNTDEKEQSLFEEEGYIILRGNQINKQAQLLSFLLGMIAIFANFYLTSSASDLAEQFHYVEIMPLFYTLVVTFSLMLRLLNAKFFLKIRHKIRIIISLILMYSGITIFLYSIYANQMLLCLFSFTFVGFGQGLCDSVLEGFTKGFRPEVLASKSQGRLFSGFAGTGLYLLIKYYKINRYLGFSILYIFYGMFYILFNKFVKLRQELAMLEQKQKKLDILLVEQNEVIKNQLLSFHKIKKVVSALFWFMLAHFIIAYFGLSNRGYLTKLIKNRVDDNLPVKEYIYEIANFAYFFFTSLGSQTIRFFKIKNTVRLASLQIIIFTMYLIIIAKRLPSLSPNFIIIFSIINGSIQGMTNVNNYFNVGKAKGIEENDKEMSLNVFSAFFEFVNVLSGISGYFISKIMKN